MQALSQHTRLLTAAVGLPVLVVAVLWGGWPLVVLVAAASLVGMEEFFALVGRPGPVVRFAGLGLGLVAVIGTARGGPGWLLGAVLAGVWLEQFDFLRRFAGRGETAPPRGVLGAALLYVPASLAWLCRFSALETFYVLAVVMAADTGAYYAGHAIGGPKVWPAVSPGKTVAGSVGGVVGAALIGACFGLGPGPGPLALAGYGALLAVVSQFGDFFESALKRVAGVKDSGRLLPGHGGLLDRVDGLLPAILAYAACRALFGLAG